MQDNVTILVIDDDDLVRACLDDQLADHYQVVAADCGQAALDLLAGGLQPAVVLCDQVMPGMTGDRVLKEIREHYPLISRVLITGYSDLQALTKAVNAGGISHYLAKPWTRPELLEVVAACVRQNQDLRHNLHLASERDQALEALEAGRRFLKEYTAGPPQPTAPRTFRLLPRDPSATPAVGDCCPE